MKNIIRLLLVILASASTQVHAKATFNETHWKDIQWQEIETEHFYVIFDQKHTRLAKSYAQKAEEAYHLLTPIFKEAPSKTTLVIRDNTDLANGYATFLPYSLITVFPVLPGGLDSISYYENWAKELMIHEYTHILNFEPTHSFYTPLRYIFGAIIRPTAILPRWWQEGLAVEMETRFTTQGRLRSPGAFATLRALAMNGQLKKETLDRVNETSIPEWPFGQRPYLLGSMMWSEFLLENDPSLVYDLLQRYSRRVPFFLNAPLVDETGADYVQWHQDTFSKLDKILKKQLEDISQAGQQELSELPLKGYNHYANAISPDGEHMAVVASEMYKGSGIRLVKKENDNFSTDKYSIAVEGSGFTRINWLPDSSGFVYDKIGTIKRHFKFRDLYLYDLKTKKSKQLTEAYRAKEPSIAPDGNNIVFVRSEAGRTSLALYKRQQDKVTVLFRPAIGVRVSEPLFLSKSEILFSGRNLKGNQHFYIYNLETKKRHKVLKDYSGVGQARMTSQGLLFASNKTGTRNLFLAEPTLHEAFPITNSKTEVLGGDIDPRSGELYFSQLTDKGSKIFHVARIERMSPAQIESPLQNKWSAAEPVTARPNLSNPRDYSSLRYLLPTYWIPFIYPLENGMLFQGSTDMADPLGRHAYTAEVSFDTETEEVSYGLSYLNSVTSVDINTYYIKNHEPLTGTSTVLANQSAGIIGSFYIPKLNNNWAGHLGGNYSYTDANAKLTRAGPKAGFSYSDLTDDITGVVSKGGKAFSFAHTEYLGDDQEQLAFGRSTFSSSYNFNHFLPTRHNFIWQLKGAFSPKLGKITSYFVGEKTVGGNYLASLINSSFLVRGYPTGTFFGRKILNFNAEYKFPFSDIYKGRGISPIFFKYLSATFFVDGVAVDGGFVNADGPYGGNGGWVSKNFTELSRQFWSAGVEFNLSSTLGYHFPVDFTLGLYQGFDQEANGDFSIFLGIGYAGHSGLTKNDNLRGWNRF